MTWVYGKNTTREGLQILQQCASHAPRFFARTNQRDRLRRKHPSKKRTSLRQDLARALDCGSRWRAHLATLNLDGRGELFSIWFWPFNSCVCHASQSYEDVI